MVLARVTCLVIYYYIRVCDALVAHCATVHHATPLYMDQNGRPTLNEGMTQLI